MNVPGTWNMHCKALMLGPCLQVEKCDKGDIVLFVEFPSIEDLPNSLLSDWCQGKSLFIDRLLVLNAPCLFFSLISFLLFVFYRENTESIEVRFLFLMKRGHNCPVSLFLKTWSQQPLPTVPRWVNATFNAVSIKNHLCFSISELSHTKFPNLGNSPLFSNLKFPWW